MSLLCAVPDTEDLNGFGAYHPIGQDLDSIAVHAADPVGSSEITLPLNVAGNDFKIVDG